jgi:hypothetical protein
VEGSPLQRGFLRTEVLRELNDRLAEIQSGKGDELLTMLCECAEPFCAEQVAVGRDHFCLARKWRARACSEASLNKGVGSAPRSR